MAWTYGGDPTASDRDKVRFLVGDTDEADPQLTDSEIDACLAEGGSPYRAASLAAGALAARFTRQVSKSIGQISIQAAERAKSYTVLALSLRKRGPSRAALPRVGGIRYSDRYTNMADADLIKTPLADDDINAACGASGAAYGSFWKG